MMSGTERLFDLRKHLPSLEGEGWRRGVRKALESVLGLPAIWRIEEELERRAAAGELPFDAFLAAGGVGVEGDGVEEAIPERGGLVVIANHPFGGADALALPALCMRVRRDVKVLANAEVKGIKALAPHLLPLEIMGGRAADRRNVKVLRDALLHVQGGGLLVVFPAGAVSYWQCDSARVEDPPWPEHTARLVDRAQCPVLPVWFHGGNPVWWQLLARVHGFLRTGFIPRAFLALKGKTVRCSAGTLLGPGDWPEEVSARNRYLRQAVENLR
jgi:putative hemolysin